MSELLDMIKTRRSIRKYKAEQITDEQLDAILEAGTYAATGMGKQSTGDCCGTETGADCKTFENECGCYGYNIRSVLRRTDRSDRAC